MKAKEYYARFVKEREARPRTPHELAEIITDILIDFQRELADLVKTRHCKTAPAIVSIVVELNQKWIVFVNLTKEKDIDKGMFIKSLKLIWDDVYQLLPDKLKADWV